MIIPIWMGDWEHECCSPEVKVGDSIEWMLYAYSDESPETTGEAPHVTNISDREVEIVGTRVPETPHTSEAYVQLSHNPLHVGVTIRKGPHPTGSLIRYCGKVWRELHTAESPTPIVGVVREIYYHAAQLEQISERGWKVTGYAGGRPIESTMEIGIGGSWAFRFLVEVGE